MKKTVSLFLIICILSGFLTGCFAPKVSLEEDIINMQIAGHLYTSMTKAQTKEERSMLKEREKAVDNIIEYMEKAAKHAFNLTDGLEKFESNLHKYMGKIYNPTTGDSSLLFGILEKITAYEVILKSREDEIRQYIKMKPETAAGKAIIDTYMLDAVCNLIDNQNEYVSWLVDNTAAVSVILEKENTRQSGKLVSSSVSLYAKQIKDDLIDTLENYNIAAGINSYIVSADYYSSLIYLERAVETIENIKSGKSDADISTEEISNLETMLKDAENSISKPPFLIPLPEKKMSFSFTRKVQAESNYEPGFYVIMEVLEMATVAEPREKVLQNSNDQVPEEPAIKKRIEKKKAEIQQTPEKATTTVDKKPSAITEKTSEAGFFASLLNSGSKKVSDSADKAKDFFIDGIVTAAQYYIKKNNNDINSQYTAIIDKLAEYIANGENIKKTNQTEAVLNLINNDLETMLGENKDTFVNMILYSNSEELIDTFGVWKEELTDGDKHVYTKDDLIDLLGIMGIEVSEVEVKPSISPSSSPILNTPAPTPPLTTTAEPVELNLPTDSTETSDNFGIAHITGLWQTIRELDSYLDNQSIIYTIYGWTDLLDYSQYEKKEILNKNGELTRIQYMDANNNAVGWEIRFYDERIEYSYHFPDDRNHDFEIIRIGTAETSYLYQVSTEDETIDRMTSIRFNEPEHPETEENIKIMVQRENGKRDGLNLTAYNSKPTYAIFDMEEIWESYTFKDNILIREMESSHKGSDIESSIKTYYDNGQISHEYTTLNGEEDGKYTIYYDDAKSTISKIANYQNGKYHGTAETFYEDGHTDDFATYANGKLHGSSYGYYPSEEHLLRYEFEYANGLENGILKSYSVKGSLNQEIEYKDGIKHGIFKDYLVDDEIHTSSYHVFGQYDNGKRTGIWEFGRDNITWIEQVYYEEDIRIWTQYADSNNRTYYNPDGSVNRVEPQN